ncbi:hypothetical protein Hanom_Chr12g01181111 [Helianthus anomalus]
MGLLQGYVGFGKFEGFNYFVAGSERYNFVQEFYNGDLQHCETSHDKRGRTAHVSICRSQTARDDPYEVQLTIRVEGYDPIQFSLTKMCESKQNEAGTSSKGWALFGIFSCTFFVISTLFCCGGFIYKTQVQIQASMLFTLSLKCFFF